MFSLNVFDGGKIVLLDNCNPDGYYEMEAGLKLISWETTDVKQRN
jgi:hypothetical protein